MKLRGVRADKSEYTVDCNHTLNEGQIAWFKSGSALNKMSAEMRASKK